MWEAAAIIWLGLFQYTSRYLTLIGSDSHMAFTTNHKLRLWRIHLSAPCALLLYAAYITWQMRTDADH